ncbi:CAP domain-containing protein [Pelagibius sp.]|uniref:CAP domain-containing protein n=1 Tax=Pelagibius sp. TaxID=1931238 RepID=UPI002613DD0D|nr:CAP domain-containing protein [Pelagibius sp.]
MANPSNLEQYQLELINRARLDPQGEAERIGLSLNAGLPAGSITAAAKQPLAFNPNLGDAARDHSRWMLDQDVFSHRGAGGSNPGDRMRDAGYTFEGNWTWGENIAWSGTTGALDTAALTLSTYEGLFESPGHRENLLGEGFREVGLGILDGQFTSGATYNALMVTQNYARSGDDFFLTGVAYDDNDGDGFYSPGEGLGGVRLSIQEAGGTTSASVTTASGGYQAALGNGSYEVMISGGGVSAPLKVGLDIESENVKLDLVGSDRIASSANVVMGQNLAAVTLLGVDDLTVTGNGLANDILGNKGDNALAGGAGADSLTGGLGNDTLDGGAGQDTAVYAGNRADYEVSANGDKVTARSGGEGVDQLNGIEFIQFNDETIAVTPAAQVAERPTPAPEPVPEPASDPGSGPAAEPEQAAELEPEPEAEPEPEPEPGPAPQPDAAPAQPEPSVAEADPGRTPEAGRAPPPSADPLPDLMPETDDDILPPTDTENGGGGPRDSEFADLLRGLLDDLRDGGATGEETALSLADLLDQAFVDFSGLTAAPPAAAQPGGMDNSGPSWASVAYGGLAGCPDPLDADTSGLENL